MQNKPNLTPVSLFKAAINTYLSNPIILLPLILLTFIQLLILELLYFYPRYPLLIIFKPIVTRIWGEMYLHYPFNFALLPELFSRLQVIIYVLVGAFLNAVTVEIIAAVNSDRKITFSSALRKTLGRYVHILVYAALSIGSLIGLSKIYGLLIQRAMKIGSETGILAAIKNTIIYGAPGAELLIGIIVTTLLAFTLPLIIVERRNIFSALAQNFRYILRSFIFVFLLVLLPTIIYGLILLLRSPFMAPISQTIPSFQIFVLISSILLTIFIDATVLTATTMYYLHIKENK